MPKYDLVEIEWLDSVCLPGWTFINALETCDLTHWSAGYLVTDAPTHVSIALSASATQLGEILTIPRPSVVAIRKLHRK